MEAVSSSPIQNAPVGIPNSTKPIFESWHSGRITDIWKEIQTNTEIDFPKVIPFQKGTDNRYENILSVEGTAIPVTTSDNPNFRFLHANQLDLSPLGIELEIIASQAPTTKEGYGFWSKVSNCGYSILNLTTKHDNLEPYAPMVGKPMIFKSVDVRAKVSVTQPTQVLRSVKATDANLGQWEAQVQTQVKVQKFEVTEQSFTAPTKTGQAKLFHYSDWPDLGVISLNELKRLVEMVETKAGNKIVVHCKAGVGRTGTFITSLALKKLIESNQITEENYDVEFKKLIVFLRKQRCAEFVQTEDQCQLVYELGISYLKDKNPTNISQCSIKEELYDESIHTRLPKTNCFSLPEIASTQLIISGLPTADSLQWTAFANHKSTIVDLTSPKDKAVAYAPSGGAAIFNTQGGTQRMIVREGDSIQLGQNPDYPSLSSLSILNYTVVKNNVETEVKRFHFNRWDNSEYQIKLPELIDLVKYVEANGGENIWVHDKAGDRSDIFITAFVLNKLIVQNKINESNLDAELMNLIVQLKTQKGQFFNKMHYELIHDFAKARLSSK